MSGRPIDEQDIRLAQVGVICASWAYLEFLLAASIWSSLNIDEETGWIVTGHLDIEARAVMAKRLAQHLKNPDDVISAIGEALKSIKAMVDERNLIIHGLSEISHDGKITTKIHRGKLRGISHEMPTPRLISLSEKIIATHEALEAVLTRYQVIDLSPISPAT